MNDGRRVNHGVSCKLLLFSAVVQILLFQLLVLDFSLLSLFVCFPFGHCISCYNAFVLAFASKPAFLCVTITKIDQKQMHCLAAAVQSVVARDTM